MAIWFLAKFANSIRVRQADISIIKAGYFSSKMCLLQSEMRFNTFNKPGFELFGWPSNRFLVSRAWCIIFCASQLSTPILYAPSINSWSVTWSWKSSYFLIFHFGLTSLLKRSRLRWMICCRVSLITAFQYDPIAPLYPLTDSTRRAFSQVGAVTYLFSDVYDFFRN